MTSCASVVIELHRGRVFLFLQEHQLYVEQEAALFRQVSCHPLDRGNVELPKQASPLAGSCERDDGIQVFLLFASKTRSTPRRQFDMRQRSSSSRSTRVCSAIHPRRFALPRRTPRWREKFQCPGSVGRERRSRDLSKEQATTVTVQHGPWLLQGFLPMPWRIERPHIAGVPLPKLSRALA